MAAHWLRTCLRQGSYPEACTCTTSYVNLTRFEFESGVEVELHSRAARPMAVVSRHTSCHVQVVWLLTEHCGQQCTYTGCTNATNHAVHFATQPCLSENTLNHPGNPSLQQPTHLHTTIEPCENPVPTMPSVHSRAAQPMAVVSRHTSCVNAPVSMLWPGLAKL